MKKSIAIILAALMAFTMFSCGPVSSAEEGKNDPKDSVTSDQEQTEAPESEQSDRDKKGALNGDTPDRDENETTAEQQPDADSGIEGDAFVNDLFNLRFTLADGEAFNMDLMDSVNWEGMGGLTRIDGGFGASCGDSYAVILLLCEANVTEMTEKAVADNIVAAAGSTELTSGTMTFAGSEHAFVSYKGSGDDASLIVICQQGYRFALAMVQCAMGEDVTDSVIARFAPAN